MLLPTIDSAIVGLIFSAAVTGMAVMWSTKKAIALFYR